MDDRAPAMSTSYSLLRRLTDQSRAEDWERFVDIYGPVIYGWARRMRLQSQDAADLTQEVLLSLNGSLKRWLGGPHRGSFRAWLSAVVRNKARDFWRAEKRRVRAGGNWAAEKPVHHAPSDEEQTGAWDDNYHAELLRWTLVAIRPEFSQRTWRAFEMFALEGVPAAQVASALGMTRSAVYVAKFRVVTRLKGELQGLIDD